MDALKLIRILKSHLLFLLFKVLTLIAFTTSANAYTDPCADLQARNQTSQSGSSLDAFPWESFKNKDVVFLGDEHTHSSPKDLIQIAKRIKSVYDTQQKNCLFLEFSISLSNEEFKKILNSTPQSQEQKRYLQYYKSIWDQAEAAGFQIYLADHRDYFTANPSINDRDKAIAENISDYLSSGTCNKGIMIVGKAHITPDENGRKLIQQHLKEMNRTSSAINIQYANDSVTKPFQMNSWNGLCPAQAQPNQNPLVFSNEKLSSIPLYPFYSPLTLIGYFDFTVLFQN